MKILVITGSPHRRGTSMLLADEFSAGAEAAGHKVIRFDAASSRIEPCRACDYCYNPPFEKCNDFRGYLKVFPSENDKNRR